MLKKGENMRSCLKRVSVLSLFQKGNLWQSGGMDETEKVEYNGGASLKREQSGGKKGAG